MSHYCCLARRLPRSVFSSRQRIPRHCSTGTRFLARGRPRNEDRLAASAAAAAAAAALTGGLVFAMVGSLERGPDEVLCESAPFVAEGRKNTPPMSLEKRELRRVALAYLVESVQATDAPGEGSVRRKPGTGDKEEGEGEGEGSTVALAAALLRQEIGDGGDDELLPPNVYDVDRILDDTPLLRANNAFHDTLNNDGAISCPYVLDRADRESGGIQAVIRFGETIAGHPKVVHGGVTALTFDNLFGMALFMQKTGAVVTAFLKVDYKAPLPCLTTAVVDITIDREEGRKLFVTGRLKSLDGTVTFSTAEALFIKPRKAPPAGGEVEGASNRTS